MEESQFPIPSFYAFRYANKAAAGYQHCSYVVANFITPFFVSPHHNQHYVYGGFG